MINIILALLKYYRSKSSFLTFCAGYRSHYVCNDISIWFAYKWSKMLTKKLAPCLKRLSIFQLTKCHQKTSVFTKCPRDPQKWTIAPALRWQTSWIFFFTHLDHESIKKPYTYELFQVLYTTYGTVYTTTWWRDGSIYTHIDICTKLILPQDIHTHGEGMVVQGNPVITRPSGRQTLPRNNRYLVINKHIIKYIKM